MRWRERRAQLVASKGAAEEDVTLYGEDLQRLDLHVDGRTLDEATQQDYRQALNAYDDAKQSLRAVKKAGQIRHVTEILDDGRYAVASVKARVAGEPLPVDGHRASSTRPTDLQCRMSTGPLMVEQTHRPRLCRGFSESSRWCRSLHPDSPGRHPAGAVLARRAGLCALGARLLRQLGWS